MADIAIFDVMQRKFQIYARIPVGGKLNKKIESIADAMVTVKQEITGAENIHVFIESAHARTGA